MHAGVGSSVPARPAVEWDRWAARYARVAVAAAFLSAVAGRFGLWSGQLNWENFARFINRTAELNPFMPASTIPLLAWAATIVETSLAVALLVGFRLQWTALGSALLLAWFGTAMALTAGPKSPLDYSVFSGSAAALLVAARERRASLASHPPTPDRPLSIP
jgi:putative oxidoreductase